MLNFDTGMKLLAAKQHAEVYKRAISALKINDKDPLAFFFLGKLATEHNSLDKALEFFAKACEHDAKNACYQAYYAKALLNIGQPAQAKLRADIAGEFETKDAFVEDMIGLVYSRTGHHELALPFFERATQHSPRWAKFHFNLAASAQFIGDFEKAKTGYSNAVAIDQKLYQAWFALVSLETQTATNNTLKTLKSLFLNVGGDAEGRLLIGHSIAKILEDLGQYKESFDWLIKAKHAQISYDKRERAKIFEAAKSYSPVRHQSSDSYGTPIFIVGLPRTGTTLVDRILSSHSAVFSAGELNVFAGLIRRKAEISAKTTTEADAILAMHSAELTDVARAYSQHISSLAGNFSFAIDKTPFNFFYAGLIHRAFPNARIIALRRGAMDSCLSNFRQIFSTHNNNHDYAFDIEDTADFYKEFDVLMNHWRETLPKNRFMEVRYEDVVLSQEDQTRRLLAFCGLDWEAACLQFHENAAPVDTASSVQVRSPLYTGAIGRWKKYGSKLDALKSALGNLADT